MARPDSFNDLSKRKRKNAQSRGKSFEGEIKRSLEMLGGFTRRFPDILNVDQHGRRKNTSTPSPPDYIHVSRDFTLLVECKAVKGKREGALPTSVSFDTVTPRQVADLLEFEKAAKRAHGLIAFCLYNDGVKRAWLIPIAEWTHAMQEYAETRSSIPVSWFTDGDTWGRYEVEWLPGKHGRCFKLAPALVQLYG